MFGYIIPLNWKKYRVACMRDACNRMTAVYPTEEKAITAWNEDRVEV